MGEIVCEWVVVGGVSDTEERINTEKKTESALHCDRSFAMRWKEFF